MIENADSQLAPRCLVRRWRDLESWITTGDLAVWDSPFDKKALGDVVSQRRERLQLSEAFGESKPITIHLTGDVSIRDRTAPYQGPVFAAYPGDIVLSKIDARNGAIGVVPSHISKAAVTSEFPVFAPRHGAANADYIRYVVRTGNFLEALRIRSSGTSGRKRISVDTFLDLEIPLPDLETQEALVNLYSARCERAQGKLQLANDVEVQGIREFEVGLGFIPDSGSAIGDTGVASFAEMDRWSHDWVLQSRLLGRQKELDLPSAELHALAAVQSGVTKSPNNRPSTHAHPYLSVANVKRWDLDLSNVKFIDVPDDELQKFLLWTGDVLVCEGGALDQVGRAALWNGEIGDCVHQNHIFRVRVTSPSILPSYLVAVLNSNIGQRYFRTRAKRTTIASINLVDLSSFPVPIPPIEAQEELSIKLNKHRGESATLRAVSMKLQTRAWDSFTASIFL